MLTYKSSYHWSEGIVLGSVLDFPGTVAYGDSLEEARRNLAAALLDMAETNLLRGEALPTPNPSATNSAADLEEPIHLVLQSEFQFRATEKSRMSLPAQSVAN